MSNSRITFNKNNNLELLRLLFALQVLIVHSAEHLNYGIPSLLSHFPGVPAFFFVSGFLIYASYLNAPRRYYLENRFLRIFPALAIVTVGGVSLALYAQGIASLFENKEIYLLWFFAQITLGQAYNPDIFRDIGVGVINGSLWTITTEILFYITVPLIVWLEKRIAHTVIILSFISFLIFSIGPTLKLDVIYRGRTIYDIISLTPINWGWMFGLGILAAKNFESIVKLNRYLPFFIIPLVTMIFIGQGPFFASNGNHLGLFYYICYVAILFWMAFGLPAISLGFDFSYGIYIWHMPVINYLLVANLPSMTLAIFLTTLAAALSWFLIEEPSLRLKHRSLKSVQNSSS